MSKTTIPQPENISIYSRNIYLLITYIPGNVLGIRDTKVI